MSNVLTLTRAARLLGVTRAELQKKISSGELPAFDGTVTVSDLLACYPNAQLEDDAEARRVASIKERAFGKRIFERALPEPEVLAARLTELGAQLARSQAQIGRFHALLTKLWDKLDHTPDISTTALREWLKQEVDMATEPGSPNPLAVKDNVLRVMTAQVTIQPSGHDFLVEGHDTLLEAAIRAGIPLDYGCSSGNCGKCKARVLSGKVKKTRLHDFVIPETEKQQGYILLCSHTAVSDVVIEAPVAGSVQDIPFQQIPARVKSIHEINSNLILLHLQTPRTQRLRFLAGQSVILRVAQSYSMQLPIASCPCDDRNVLFHVHRQPGNLFSDFVSERLRPNDTVEMEGPLGEFILHEKSGRPLYFLAFDTGFAPIKSLIEHALSLDIETITLHWFGSDKAHIYLPNIPHAWRDALDGFSYAEHVMGFDLRMVDRQREEKLRQTLQAIADSDDRLLEGDIYVAGPEDAVHAAEQFFLDQGLPGTRVLVTSVK